MRESDIAEQKKTLRVTIRSNVDGIDAASRRAAGELLKENLLSLPIVDRAMTIFAFYPTNREIDLKPFLHDVIASGKRLALPRVVRDGMLAICEVDDFANQLEVGRYGILEPKIGMPPVSERDIDAVIAPGVAFSIDGGRLGQGGGYYDRLLAAPAMSDTPAIGVCFDCQIVASVPRGRYDVGVNWIVTEKRIIDTRA